MFGIVAGVMTLFSGLIFVSEDSFPEFYNVTLVAVFILNVMFLVQWFYLLLLSLNYKNENFQRIVKIYGMIL